MEVAQQRMYNALLRRTNMVQQTHIGRTIPSCTRTFIPYIYCYRCTKCMWARDKRFDERRFYLLLSVCRYYMVSVVCQTTIRHLFPTHSTLEQRLSILRLNNNKFKLKFIIFLRSGFFITLNFIVCFFFLAQAKILLSLIDIMHCHYIHLICTYHTQFEIVSSIRSETSREQIMTQRRIVTDNNQFVYSSLHNAGIQNE